MRSFILVLSVLVASAAAQGDLPVGGNECYTEANGADYRGTVSQSAKGVTCQNWVAQHPQEHGYTPDIYSEAGIGDHNYCRNPSGFPTLWCYVIDAGAQMGSIGPCTQIEAQTTCEVAPVVLKKTAKLYSRRAWPGGYLANLDFNIGKRRWKKVEVIFPREVFKLQVEGCDVKIQKKKTTLRSGNRKGTTFMIVPTSPDDATPGPDGKTRITLIAKIWRNLRGFTKRKPVAYVHYYE